MSKSIVSTENPDHLAARPLSRLSYQIMGLNLMAVLVLVMGVFYLDQYKKDLTTTETELMATEARLYASVVSDNAFVDNHLDLNIAEGLFANFNLQKNQRLLLFAPDGTTQLDTKTPYRLISTSSREFQGLWESVLDVILSSVTDLFSIDFDLPVYPITYDQDFHSFPDAGKAIHGEMSLSAWQSREGELILSVAVPIIKNGQIIGAILVTRTDIKIEHIFNVMRIGVMQFFFGSLLVTLCFSLFLSASIGHPLRKLASAAEAVRAGKVKIEAIPDFSYRKDEIGELSLSLREMTQALQERIESIERFAADVSHELKNPLTSMRSAIETLEKVKRDQDRQKLMAIVMHDLIRMDRLISDISRASRLDVELLRDVLTPIDLRDIVLPLIDAYKKPMERAGQSGALPQSLQYTGLSNPVLVLGQSVRLSQVFQNLIENALSFSPPGKVVTISVRQGPEFVNVIVDDEGPGIPENRLEQVFERFYTERPNAESFGSHSGLGLSIVRQIVDAHEGSIQAQNRTDDNGKVLGARFTVKLKPA